MADLRTPTPHYVDCCLTVAVWTTTPEAAIEAARQDMLAACPSRGAEFEYHSRTAEEVWARNEETKR